VSSAYATSYLHFHTAQCYQAFKEHAAQCSDTLTSHTPRRDFSLNFGARFNIRSFFNRINSDSKATTLGEW
ncbi:hypothetical protein, partial [Marinibactrum halimedae]|uniref:hypothetical protein n=1 Tax=Marinibactrum halimedae TaxID=1444977 RepID=UPI001E5196B5